MLNLGYRDRKKTIAACVSEKELKRQELAKQEAERSNVDAEIQIGDCEYLDYPDNYFDVYVAMGVIEYMDEQVVPAHCPLAHIQPLARRT